MVIIFYDGEILEGKGEIYFKKEVLFCVNKKIIWFIGYWNENLFVKQNCYLIFLCYVDVLLMYVEVCNELGESWEVFDKLEMVCVCVCRMVYLVDMIVGLFEIMEIGKEKFCEIIWNECCIELVLEGYCFFDLICVDKVVLGYVEKMMKVYGKINFLIVKYVMFFILQKQVDILQGVFKN